MWLDYGVPFPPMHAHVREIYRGRAVQSFIPNVISIGATWDEMLKNRPLAECNTGGFFVGTLWVIRLNKCAVAAGWWRNHAASVKRANPWQWIDKAYNCRRLAPLIDQLSHVVPHDLKKEKASSWKKPVTKTVVHLIVYFLISVQHTESCHKQLSLRLSTFM